MSRKPTEEEIREYLLSITMHQAINEGNPEIAFTEDELARVTAMFMNGELEELVEAMAERVAKVEA